MSCFETFGNEVKYEATVERVKIFVANKVAMMAVSSLAPMGGLCWWGGHWEWGGDQCHGCQGLGHVRPTVAANQRGLPKGKSKGKGTVKGSGKGGNAEGSGQTGKGRNKVVSQVQQPATS